MTQRTLIARLREYEKALTYAQNYVEQAMSGYGFYRPSNPNNFTPDPDCCTEKEIANHKAACEAYNVGTYVPDHSDGWITPEIHVTKAPWGIGSYCDSDETIDAALADVRDLIQEVEGQEAINQNKRAHCCDIPGCAVCDPCHGL